MYQVHLFNLSISALVLLNVSKIKLSFLLQQFFLCLQLFNFKSRRTRFEFHCLFLFNLPNQCIALLIYHPPFLPFLLLLINSPQYSLPFFLLDSVEFIQPLLLFEFGFPLHLFNPLPLFLLLLLLQDLLLLVELEYQLLRLVKCLGILTNLLILFMHIDMLLAVATLLGFLQLLNIPIQILELLLYSNLFLLDLRQSIFGFVLGIVCLQLAALGQDTVHIEMGVGAGGLLVGGEGDGGDGVGGGGGGGGGLGFVIYEGVVIAVRRDRLLGLEIGGLLSLRHIEGWGGHGLGERRRGGALFERLQGLGGRLGYLVGGGGEEVQQFLFMGHRSIIILQFTQEIRLPDSSNIIMQVQPEIQRNFKIHTVAIQQLFSSEVPEAERFELDTDTYLRSLFRRLQDILQTKQIWTFKQYLEQGKFSPLQYDISNLNFEKFSELFDLWIQSQYTNRSIAESVYIEQTQSMIRNPELEQILQKKSHIVHNFTSTLKRKKKLQFSEMAQLLRKLLSEYYIYELYKDQDDLASKPIFSSTLQKILKQYQQSERKNCPFGESSLFMVDEIHDILKFWENSNPELVVDSKKRKAWKSFGVQTQHMNKTGKIVKKTSCSSNANKQTARFTVQATINNAIQQLSQHLLDIKDSQWIQSIDYLLITLKKQRRKLYPKYKLDAMGKSKLRLQNFQHQFKIREFQQNISAIYDYYKEKKVKQTSRVSMSILGDFAQDALHSNRQNVTTEDYDLFVEELLSFANLEDKVIKQNGILGSIRNFSKEQFLETVKKLTKKKQAGITQQIINNFVRQVIRPLEPMFSTPMAGKKTSEASSDVKMMRITEGQKILKFKKKESEKKQKKHPRIPKLESLKLDDFSKNHGITHSPSRKLSHRNEDLSHVITKDLKVYLERGPFTSHKPQGYTGSLKRGFSQAGEYSDKPKRKYKGLN